MFVEESHSAHRDEDSEFMHLWKRSWREMQSYSLSREGPVVGQAEKLGARGLMRSVAQTPCAK
jgi:hypothetical protein